MIKLIGKITFKLTNIFSKIISLEKILKLLTFARLRFQFIYQKKHNLPGNLIVSLTSFPQRFSTLHLTIKTLLSQSMRPDEIILWIYEKDFSDLPKSILDLQSDIFSIKNGFSRSILNSILLLRYPGFSISIYLI